MDRVSTHFPFHKKSILFAFTHRFGKLAAIELGCMSPIGPEDLEVGVLNRASHFIAQYQGSLDRVHCTVGCPDLHSIQPCMFLFGKMMYD